MKSCIAGTARYATFGHSSLFIGNDLYLIGGADEKGKLTNAIQILNFENGSVDAIDPKTNHTARQFHSSIFHKNKIYIFGGKSESYKNDLIEIDINNKSVNTVTTSGSIPSPRFGHAACVWNNKMLIYGGFEAEDSTSSQMFELDFTSMTWNVVNSKGSSTPSARYQFGSCVLGNHWNIFGGRSGVNSYNDVWSFEFASSTWKELKTHGQYPSPRWGCTLSGIPSSSSSNNNKDNTDGLYVFGGKTKTKVAENNQLFRLDLHTGEWSQIKLKQTARFYHTCNVKNSQLFIAGGSTSSKNAVGAVLCIDIPVGTEDTTTTTQNHIDSLPLDAFLLVLSYLDAIDLIRASYVNRFWYKHTQNENLWRDLFENRCKDVAFKTNGKALAFSFIKNFKATDTQNEIDFNMMKRYNQWVDHVNSSNPSYQHNYRTSSSYTNTKDESNANPTQPNDANSYKAKVIPQLLFDMKEVEKKCDLLEDQLHRDYGWNWRPDRKSINPRVIGKMLIVGDGNIGKTCLLITIAQNLFPNEYIPTVFDYYCVPVVWNRIPFQIGLWDTYASDEDRLRPLSYPWTTFVVVAFSVVNPSSYASVRAKWVPELDHYAPLVPKILVATKIDLRTDQETLEKLAVKKLAPITTEQGEALAKEMKAIAYVETSAVTGEGVFRVLEEGINFTFAGKEPPRKKCAIM